MAETLHLNKGTRLRVKGQSYEVAEDGTAAVELAPVKAQSNRHLKFICPSQSCAAAGQDKGLGDENGRWFVRASRSLLLDGAAICGRCCNHVTVLEEDVNNGLVELVA